MLLAKALPCFHGFCDRDLACLSPSIAPHPQTEFVKAIWYIVLYLCFLNKIRYHTNFIISTISSWYLPYHICYIISSFILNTIWYIIWHKFFIIHAVVLLPIENGFQFFQNVSCAPNFLSFQALATMDEVIYSATSRPWVKSSIVRAARSYPRSFFGVHG
jgi:hypothetical protein